jgi:hypothetical protein
VVGQILEIEGYNSSLARIQDSTEAKLTARDGHSYIEQDDVIGLPQESIDGVVDRRSNWRSRASTDSWQASGARSRTGRRTTT